MLLHYCRSSLLILPLVLLLVEVAVADPKLTRFECRNVDCNPASCTERQLTYGECTYLNPSRSIIARGCQPGGYALTQRYVQPNCPVEAGWATFRYRENECIQEDGVSLRYLCPEEKPDGRWWVIVLAVGIPVIVIGGIAGYALHWRKKNNAAKQLEQQASQHSSRTEEPYNQQVVEGVVVPPSDAPPKQAASV